MILLLDNYDSFKYNLFQMVGSIEPDLKVVRNDALTVDEIRNLNCSGDNGRFDRFQFLQSIGIENSYVEPIEIT